MKKTAVKLFLASALFLLFMPVSTFASTLMKNESDLKKDLSKYSVSVPVDGNEQRFSFDKDEITKIKVKKITYNKAKTAATVRLNVNIDRKVAVVGGNARITYKLKKKNWKLSGVRYTKTELKSISLIGHFTGTYVAGQGETRADFDIPDVTTDGFLKNALFSFSPVPTNPTVPRGSYSLIGGYDLKKGTINFSGNEWIERPAGWQFINFDAYVDLINKKIVGKNNELSITKAEKE